MLNQTSRRLLHLAIAAGAALALGAPPAAAQTTPPTASQGTVTPPSVTQQPDIQIPASGPAIELTMEEAVTRAMQNNLGLQSARMDIDDAALAIAQARAAFLPRLSTNFSRNSSSAQGLTNPDGTRGISKSTTINGGSTMSGALPWYGSSYSVNWNAQRRETPGASSSFNPSLSSQFSFSFSQPLWGGLAIDSTRGSLEVSERTRAIEDLNLQQSVISLDATVRLAYLNLVAARERYKVSVQNLQIAEESLRNSRARVEVGVAPQTDIVGDEAQVATSRVLVISSEAAIATEEDNLRSLILDPARPDYWDVNLIPTDQVLLTERDINLDEVIQQALDNRLDREIQLRTRELTDLNLRISKENTKPDLSFNVDYSAGASGGRAGIEGLDNRSFGTVLGETFGGTYPRWTTSVQLSYPIGQTAAKAGYARNQIASRQLDISLQQLDLQIIQQVRDAVRQVENAYRQVQAARTAMEASQLNLDNEERKLQVGLSRSLDVQFRQQSLAQARIQELNAIIAYNRSLIILDRVTRVR